MGLTSALRTAPALGDAIGSTLSLVRGPLRAELSLVLRQFQMGVPLDEALLDSARRVGSIPLSAVVATLRVARRTGGNLNTTLERNAHTLREMARLEALVRAKTASGRAQSNAISLVPVILIAGLNHLDPAYLAPVHATTEGHLLAVLACLMWVAAVFWARKIVAVDL
jgi:tight adherence protein B